MAISRWARRSDRTDGESSSNSVADAIAIASSDGAASSATQSTTPSDAQAASGGSPRSLTPTSGPSMPAARRERTNSTPASDANDGPTTVQSTSSKRFSD